MPIQSAQPELKIPNCTVYDLIFSDIAEQDRDRIAVVDDSTGSKTTYAELKEFIDAFAGALAHRGVKLGDVVGLHCPNSLAFVVAFHGALRAGATVTTVGTRLNSADIVKQLRDSAAGHLMSMSSLGTAGFEAASESGIASENVIDLSDEESGLWTFIAEKHAPPVIDIDPATHVAALLYSSGTTGMPKGVKLSHTNLVANTIQIAKRLGPDQIHSNSVVMCVLPFFHSYGLSVLLNSSLYQRSQLVTMPAFDLERFLAAHQKYAVTFTFIAPPIAVSLAKNPVVDEYDTSTLETMMSAAATLDGHLAQAVADRLGVDIIQGYGMTETSPLATMGTVGVTPEASIGLPVPNTEIKIVNVGSQVFEEIHAPANEGEYSADGELWVRGPQVMLGYLNNEDATANMIREDGWLRTGDIAKLDRHGNLYLVDRMKELIKYKGYQVAPAELEALLMTHDSVADAAVVGYIRDEDGEELPRAFLVLQQDIDSDDPAVSAEAIMDWVAEKVSSYKKIRMVEFVDEIPKSATGKILRKELRNLPAIAQG